MGCRTVAGCRSSGDVATGLWAGLDGRQGDGHGQPRRSMPALSDPCPVPTQPICEAISFTPRLHVLLLSDKTNDRAGWGSALSFRPQIPTCFPPWRRPRLFRFVLVHAGAMPQPAFLRHHPEL